MDANLLSAISNVALGLIANGITSFVAHHWNNDSKEITIEDRLRDILENQVNLTTVISSKFGTLSDLDSKKLNELLSSPEMEAYARQIYACILAIDTDIEDDRDGIRKGIETFFILNLEMGAETCKSIAAGIFDIVWEGSTQVLNAEIRNGGLFAHEVKDVARHNQILDEIATIRKSLDIIEKVNKPDVQEIQKFEETYRNAVGRRHGVISPPLTGSKVTKPIDQLYVCPSMETVHKKKVSERVEMKDFYKQIYRTVLLGNPGGGKSTLTLKVCHDLSKDYGDRLVASRELTPILVVLREYGAEKAEKGISIVKHIEQKARSRYQLEYFPDLTFEYLLLNGRAMVIFDGLDELIDTSDRQEISNDIMSFCGNYPNVPVLVTSREVGYDQAPLDHGIFETYRIAPFNKMQVEHYAKNWFDLDNDLSSTEKKQKTKSFVSESEVAKDIRSNPLMLALMCNIYLGENYIPRKKYDLYKKCSEMLFERWDRDRKIEVPLAIRSHVDQSMKFIAHWMYDKAGTEGSLTEHKLIQITANYLLEKRFEELDEAEKAADEFIKFCRGRAWVFTDTGTTKDGENLYQFTHRTFLEYFTASHLVRINRTPEQLAATLIPKIRRKEWDSVAQLAVQIQNHNIEDAGSEIVEAILKETYVSEGLETWYLLSFASKCLEFLVPSPKVIKSLVSRIFAISIEQRYKQIQESNNLRERRMNPKIKDEAISLLLLADDENRNVIAEELKSNIIKYCSSSDKLESALALDLGAHLDMIYRSFEDKNTSNRNHGYWVNFVQDILFTNVNHVVEHSKNHLSICKVSWSAGIVTIDQMVQWHGIEGLFREESNLFFERFTISSTAVHLARSVWHLQDKSSGIASRINHSLGVLADYFLLAETPWVTSYQPGLDLEFLIPNKFERVVHKLGNDQLFSLFCIFATAVEITGEANSILYSIEETNQFINEDIFWILVSRFEEIEESLLESEVDKLNFTIRQKEFIQGWIRADICLVEGFDEEWDVLIGD